MVELEQYGSSEVLQTAEDTLNGFGYSNFNYSEEDNAVVFKDGSKLP